MDEMEAGCVIFFKWTPVADACKASRCALQKPEWTLSPCKRTLTTPKRPPQSPDYKQQGPVACLQTAPLSFVREQPITLVWSLSQIKGIQLHERYLTVWNGLSVALLSHSRLVASPTKHQFQNKTEGVSQSFLPCVAPFLCRRKKVAA